LKVLIQLAITGSLFLMCKKQSNKAIIHQSRAVQIESEEDKDRFELNCFYY